MKGIHQRSVSLGDNSRAFKRQDSEAKKNQLELMQGQKKALTLKNVRSLWACLEGELTGTVCKREKAGVS